MNGTKAKRVLLVLMAAATLWRVWMGPIILERPALAQIPDAGTQRKELLDELRRTNHMLAEIKLLLEQRTLNVRLVDSDKP